MKRLSSTAAIVVFVAALAVSVVAQAPAPSKIGFINTEDFYSVEGGITTILNGYKKLEIELKPEVSKYEAKVTQFQTLNKAYSDLLEKGNSGVPIDQADATKKRDQLQDLQTEIKRMQEDLKAKQDKREGEIMAPISAAIGESIQTYAKQKGFTAVFDIAGLANARQILYADPGSNITGDFIKFYNAKPAGTATTQ